METQVYFMKPGKEEATRICRMICQVTDELRDVWLQRQPEQDVKKIMSLTISQQRMLRTVWRMTLAAPQGVMLKELASQLSLSNSAVSVMVDAMVKRGFLERFQDENDRRKIFIRISEIGLERSRLHEASFGELSKDFFAGLPGEQLASFCDTLDKFQQFLIKENKK